MPNKGISHVITTPVSFVADELQKGEKKIVQNSIQFFFLCSAATLTSRRVGVESTTRTLDYRPTKTSP